MRQGGEMGKQKEDTEECNDRQVTSVGRELHPTEKLKACTEHVTQVIPPRRSYLNAVSGIILLHSEQTKLGEKVLAPRKKKSLSKSKLVLEVRSWASVQGNS